MGISIHGQFCRKFKRAKCNSKLKTASKGSNIITDLIVCSQDTCKKREKPIHVDTVVNSTQTLPFLIVKALSNTLNNPIPPFDCYRTKLSTSYRADQAVVYNEISHSYDCITSYPKDSVFFKEVNRV